MTGAAQTETEEEWQALPQRVPRERRSAKRARTDEPNAAGNAVGTEAEAVAAAVVAAADPLAAVAGEAGSGPGSEQQQAQQKAGEGQQQHEGQAEGVGGVAERPAAGRVDLPAYRSSAVAGEKFECERPACPAQHCPAKQQSLLLDAAIVIAGMVLPPVPG